MKKKGYVSIESVLVAATVIAICGVIAHSIANSSYFVFNTTNNSINTIIGEH